MGSFWKKFKENVYETREEQLRRNNAEIDKKIGEKELEIKLIKKKLQIRKENRYNKRMQKRKAKIKQVSIDGIQRTSENLVMDNVSDLFNVENFKDLILKTKEASKRLKSLGCFSSVNMMVDTLLDHPHHYQVLIKVKESRNQPFFNVGLECPQQNVVTASMRPGIKNILGCGDRLQLDINHCFFRFNERKLNFCIPMMEFCKNLKSDFYLKQENRELKTLNSSLSTSTLGTSLSLTAFNNILNLSTSLETKWLDNKYRFNANTSSENNPCFAQWSPFMKYSGHLQRTCLTTTISLDTRNDELLPAHGVLLSASHTASSNLVGQISHLVKLKTCFHYSLIKGVSMSWRSLFSTTLTQYPLQPQELQHPPPGLYWRGLEDMSGRTSHLTSILCVTSNLPLITSQSLIGTKYLTL